MAENIPDEDAGSDGRTLRCSVCLEANDDKCKHDCAGHFGRNEYFQED